MQTEGAVRNLHGEIHAQHQMAFSPGFAGSDTNDLGQIADEDFAVADLTGSAGPDDGVQHDLQFRVRHDEFHLDFREEIDVYSVPRYISVWPFWRPKPRTSVMVMPVMPCSSAPF